MPMKFWGVEVKARETLKIIPDCFKIIHVSQAALGEVKDVKGAISVPLRLKIGDKSYVIGNLSAKDRPQLMLDLVFEKQFELSHDWKRGSVYFAGYTANDPCISDGDDSDEEYSSDEELDIHAIAKLKSKSKEDGVFNGDEAGDSDVLEESTDISLENGSEPSFTDDSDFSDEDGSSDDAPSTDELITKRPSKSAAEITVPAKKAKLSIPEKTGGKKGQAGNAASTGNKSKGQNQKSGKSSSKSFGSDTRKKARDGGK